MRLMMTLDTAPLDTPLWAVYGPTCFPTVFACIIKDYPDHGRAIWGWSVHRRKGGYRTLGTGHEWVKGKDVWFFRSRQDAFDHIASLFPAEAGR